MCDSSEVGMKTEHRKAIQRNFKILVDNCNIDLLLPELKKRNVFTEKMIKRYMGPNKLENKRKLFLTVDSRGPDAFQNLVEALTAIGQQHLAMNLTSGLDNETNPVEISGAIPFKLPTNPDAKVDNEKVLQRLPKQLNANIERPLEIKVTPASRFFNNDDSKIDIYPTISQNRGSALIINNIVFNIEDDRQGAECDGISLQLLFKQIGLKVEYHENKPAKEMAHIIENFAVNADLKDCDMAFVVIASHGSQSEKGESFVKGTDNGKVSTSWIESQFNNVNCEYLKGKPKIFIYQACRGENNDYLFLHQDEENVGLPNFSPRNSDREYSDMLIVHSTLPGYKSHRDIYTGSWYIQHLCKIFMEHAHDTDVERLLKMVDKELMVLKSSEGSLQTPTYQSVSFKICYLHPGIYKQGDELKYFSDI